MLGQNNTIHLTTPAPTTMLSLMPLLTLLIQSSLSFFTSSLNNINNNYNNYSAHVHYYFEIIDAVEDFI